MSSQRDETSKTRRSKSFAAVALVAALFTTASAQQSYETKTSRPEPVTWFFGLGLGSKEMRGEGWQGETASQGAAALYVSGGGKKWPVHLAANLIVSGVNDSYNSYYYAPYDPTQETVSIGELDVGVRKFLRNRKLKPFIGGGICWIDAERVRDQVYDHDDGFGSWAEFGLLWKVGRWDQHVGFGLRASRARVELLGEQIEAGGNHFYFIWGRVY